MIVGYNEWNLLRFVPFVPFGILSPWVVYFTPIIQLREDSELTYTYPTRHTCKAHVIATHFMQAHFALTTFCNTHTPLLMLFTSVSHHYYRT